MKKTPVTLDLKKTLDFVSHEQKTYVAGRANKYVQGIQTLYRFRQCLYHCVEDYL